MRWVKNLPGRVRKLRAVVVDGEFVSSGVIMRDINVESLLLRARGVMAER